jgi:hypothetical protein
MIFGLTSQVFEDGVFPKSFHMIPIFDLAVTNGIVDTVIYLNGVSNRTIKASTMQHQQKKNWKVHTRTTSSSKSLLADEKVEVFSTSFLREIAAGGRDTGIGATAGTALSSGYDSGEDERWRVITGKAKLGQTGTTKERIVLIEDLSQFGV